MLLLKKPKSMLVKRVCAKTTIPSDSKEGKGMDGWKKGEICEEGEVFVQYFDKENIFYPELWKEPTGIGLRLTPERMAKHFEELEPIEAKETIYYQKVKELQKSHINQIMESIDKLTSEEKSELLGNYCRICGIKNPRCQCWNDE